MMCKEQGAGWGRRRGVECVIEDVAHKIYFYVLAYKKQIVIVGCLN
jgi:hypothetical protein